MQSTDPQHTEQKKRTDLLTILCILSFTGSGLAAFSNLVLLLTYDEMGPIMEDLNLNMEEFKMILSGGKSFFISGFFLYIISLAGISGMWRLKRIGFHLYAAAQIFILLLPVVSIDGFQFSIPGLLLSAAFIYAYSTQLKFMH